MGDFNAYSEEDPIQALTDAGWSDLVADLTDDQYTYTFDGELGSLDHVIASPGIAAQVTGVGVWGINRPSGATASTPSARPRPAPSSARATTTPSSSG